MNGNETSKPEKLTSNHKRSPLVVLAAAIVIVLGILILVINKSPKSYGVFLDKGLLDTWELKNGVALLTIEDEEENFKEYQIYLTEGTRVLKAAYPEGGKDQNTRTLKLGDYKEIRDGMFIEIYLENPYEDVTRQAKTVIYWE